MTDHRIGCSEHRQEKALGLLLRLVHLSELGVDAVHRDRVIGGDRQQKGELLQYRPVRH